MTQRKHRFIGKGNVLFQYSVFMLFVISIKATLLGAILTNLVREHVIRMHGDFYSRTLSFDVNNLIERGSQKDFSDLIQKLEMSGQLVHARHIAVWNREGEIIFGDGNFMLSAATKDNFKRALICESTYRRLQPSAGEAHDSEIAIFLPVRDTHTAITGVIAFHESDRDLSIDLKAAEQKIILYIFITGAVIYALLFLLYFRSYLKLRKATERVEQSQASIIFAMSSLSSLRDQETGGHLERCSLYVAILAENLRKTKEFKPYITREYIQTISSVAPLHDIGKVGISDAILRKPGKLTDQEYDEMKRHSAMGADILLMARNKLSFLSNLDLAIELTRHHHERWDGKGYPDGLSLERIPLSARIMAVADVYDALRSDRYYKKGLTHDESFRIIVEGSGSQFDPDIIGVFQTCHREFEAVFSKQ